jgi:hypothetical protein|uniref:Uncharacterized protein n=1 Tax=Zea mays TaxID=4577 RepID=A0A804LFT5_MAIZE
MSPLPPSSDTAVALSPSSMLTSILLPTSTATPPLPPRLLPRPRHVLLGRNDRSPTVVPAGKPKLVGEKSKGAQRLAYLARRGPMEIQHHRGWATPRWRRCRARRRGIYSPIKRAMKAGPGIGDALGDIEIYSAATGEPVLFKDLWD